jgi:hypothetical protein
MGSLFFSVIAQSFMIDRFLLQYLQYMADAASGISRLNEWRLGDDVPEYLLPSFLVTPVMLYMKNVTFLFF